MQKLDSNSRCYPTPTEYELLISYLKNHFNIHERSQKRNAVVQEAANTLKTFNQHWNNNSVRKWFNNNKYQYKPDLKDGLLLIFNTFNKIYIYLCIYGNFFVMLNSKNPGQDSPDIFYRIKLQREGIPPESRIILNSS